MALDKAGRITDMIQVYSTMNGKGVALVKEAGSLLFEHDGMPFALQEVEALRSRDRLGRPGKQQIRRGPALLTTSTDVKLSGSARESVKVLNWRGFLKTGGFGV